jgi:hypothetical protein
MELAEKNSTAAFTIIYFYYLLLNLITPSYQKDRRMTKVFPQKKPLRL